MSFLEPWSLCEAIVSNTAETVTLSGVVNYLRIQNGINAIVWLKFNWVSGDTECSATNFDVRMPAYDSFEFAHDHPTAPKLNNVRVLCATSGRIGFWGW